MNFTYVGLTEIFRQSDPEFKRHCSNLCYRLFNTDTLRYFEGCDYFKDDAVRLFAFKKFRDRYNNQQLNLLPGNDIMIRAFDTSEYIKEICLLEPGLKTIKEIRTSSNSVVRELIERHLVLEKIFMSQTQSEYMIRLHLNCHVMVIQNCTEDGVINGSSGTFVRWRSRMLSDVEKGRRQLGLHVGLKYCELDKKNGERYQDHDMIIRLDDTDREVFVRFSEMSEEDHYDKKYVRRQFPVVLIYAMTMHKSQGMTLKRVVVDMHRCTRKLAYTAITRTVSRDSLGVLNLNQYVAKKLSEPAGEDQAVNRFYQYYVGVDIPTKSLTYSL